MRYLQREGQLVRVRNKGLLGLLIGIIISMSCKDPTYTCVGAQGLV